MKNYQHSLQDILRQIIFLLNLQSLYDPNQYFLELGGKRVSPVLCLMGNELFGEINPDAWHVATAIELFHNFTLIHDDIMDNAPLRRGMQTVHEKYGESTALLAGDVMLVAAYDYLNKISINILASALSSCLIKLQKKFVKGSNWIWILKNREAVDFEDYLHMINLKTSVLLAASLQMGAVLGGAGERNQHLYMSLEESWDLLSRCRMIIWMLLEILKNLVNR